MNKTKVTQDNSILLFKQRVQQIFVMYWNSICLEAVYTNGVYSIPRRDNKLWPSKIEGGKLVVKELFLEKKMW